MAKNKKYLLIPLFFVFVASCGQVDGPSTETINDPASVFKATRTLRIGATPDASGPIAVTAAIDNRESMVVLRDGAGTIISVLYKTPSNQVVSIDFDSEGKPVTVVASEATLSFFDYAGGVVTVASEFTDGTSSIDTVPFTGRALAKAVTLKSAQLARESDDFLSSALDRSSFAVRSFGCSVASLSNVPSSQFSTLASTSCSSLLVDTINTTVRERRVSESVVEVESDSSCDSARNSFRDAQRCAVKVGNKTVQQAIDSSDAITDEVIDNSDPETGEVVDDTLEDGTDVDDVVPGSGSISSSSSSGSATSSSSSAGGSSSSSSSSSTSGDPCDSGDPDVPGGCDIPDVPGPGDPHPGNPND